MRKLIRKHSLPRDGAGLVGDLLIAIVGNIEDRDLEIYGSACLRATALT